MIKIICVPGHLKRNHLEELNQKCCYCSKKLSSYEKVLRHITIVHFDIRKFPCPICNYRFTVKRDVDKHINSAHLKNGQKMEPSPNSNDINNFQPVVEMNPNQKLKTPAKLVAEIPTSPPSEQATNDEITVHESKKKYSCEICQQKFGFRSNLKRHLKKGTCLAKINAVNKNVQFATAKGR